MECQLYEGNDCSSKGTNCMKFNLQFFLHSFNASNFACEKLETQLLYAHVHIT